MYNTAEMMRRTGYCRVQLWRKARDPEDDFPAPLQLGANKIGWIEDEVHAWEKSRPRVNYAPTSNDEGAATVAA